MSKVSLKSIFLTFLGILYMALGILSYRGAIGRNHLDGLFWFSYAALFIIGLGMVLKKSDLIASQFSIILVPYIFWDTDFFYILLTGNSLWGITDYFFTAETLLIKVLILQHILAIPAALLGIYLIKLKNTNFWKFSAVQVLVFFVIVRLFTIPENNINCAFTNCLPFYISPVIYPFFWFLSYFIMIGIATFILYKVKVFWNKSPKTL